MTKHQIIINNQISITRRKTIVNLEPVWSLELGKLMIGIYLDIGAWCLVIGLFVVIFLR
jgi:hypothetical protein